jgi:DNA-directed RNA polymerase subunit RPC12/RpoP
MFIGISDKENLLAKLNEISEKESVVIHYRCSHCSDEQVTYDYKPSEVIEMFSNGDSINAGYDCTNCGINEHSIEIDYIYGLEVL